MNPAQKTGPIRVIVVDDSQLMRRMISSALRVDGIIDVVAEAADTREARALIKLHNPDVVTLDVEMPGMDGLAFLEKIMELRPMPVIMVSTLTASGTDVTIRALQAGAVDALPKPAGREQLDTFGRLLRSKVQMACSARVGTYPAPAATPPGAAARPPGVPGPQRPSSAPQILAIGASTGGVGALGTLLERLPADLPPVLITQHMPPVFTSRFAARLDAVLPLDVAEARDGELLQRGMVRIAPGDAHLTAARSAAGFQTRLDDSGPISGHKPSVDVLFNSVAVSAGRQALGVILTGMGRDGAAGMRAMRNTGAYCIGQDEASCVVYGMPKAARQLDAVDEELHILSIGPRIAEFVNARTDRKTA